MKLINDLINHWRIYLAILVPSIISIIIFSIQCYHNEEKILLKVSNFDKYDYRIKKFENYPDSICLKVNMEIIIINNSNVAMIINNIKIEQSIKDSNIDLLVNSNNSWFHNHLPFGLNAGEIKEIFFPLWIGTNKSVHEIVEDKIARNKWKLRTILDTLNVYDNSLFSEIEKQANISIEIITGRNNKFIKKINFIEELDIE